MDWEELPDRFYHCYVSVEGSDDYAIVNDLTKEDLRLRIVSPWLRSRPFNVAGTIVPGSDKVREIRIVRTDEPQQVYAERHNREMRASGIADLATNRRILPFREGEDLTYELLFSGMAGAAAVAQAPEADVGLVMRLCERLPNAARILANRRRADKEPFTVEDEYDAQDLLHALLRGYVKYSVDEDPLGKVAGTKSGRADISIEDLGVLIEIKYAHGPDDQKRIFEEFSEDLVLYPKWSPLETLIYLIYNSADLRDPEALERLSGEKEIDEKRFDVRVVLA